jgi:anti-sigma B factor antagonist
MEAREIQAGGLTLRSERQGATHTVALEGEFDLTAEREFDAELRRVEEGDAERIVVDLRGVTFMDSTGFRVLLQADARSRLDSGRLRVRRSLSPQVTDAFELLGLESRIDFID